MRKINFLRPLESYSLLTTFVFTEQFDRNLNLEGVEASFQKQLLERLHEFLINMTEPTHPIGAALIIVFCISIALSIIGKESRKINDLLAVYLSAAWVIELLTMNILLFAPLKSPTLMLIELLLFIPVVITAFSWWYWRINQHMDVKTTTRQLHLRMNHARSTT